MSREAAHAALAERFGPRFTRAAGIRAQHVNTVTWVAPQPPEAVVTPGSTEEVAEIVGVCAAHGVPIIPFGTGTSVEGQVNAPEKGVCVSLREMGRIVAVHAEDFDAVVEAGVTRGSSTRICGTRGCFSRSIRGRMRRSGAWHPRGPRGRMRCGMGRCGTTWWR